MARKMDLCDITGSFGRWQLRVFLVLFFINVVGVWQNLCISFFAPNVDFRCVEPQGQNNTKPTLDTRCNVAISTNQSTTHVVPCTRWEYDTTSYSDTIVSEWDLVCDREWLVSFAKSIYMFGFLLSVFIFGQLSDSIGRFPSMVIAYFLSVVSTCLSQFSSSYLMFAILRFSQAFGRAGLSAIGFVLIMEMTGPQHRTGVSIVTQLAWSLGFMTLPGVAWFFKNWFWLHLVISVPFLLIVPAFSFMPESPRWLLMHGKWERLKKNLSCAATVNGRELKVDVKETFKSRVQEEESKASETVFDLFKSPQMRYRTFNMIYLWMVNSFIYYALSYNINDLAGNPYINFFVAGVLELPSYALLYWGIRRFGRRPTLVALMSVGGSACLAIIPIPQELSWLSTSLSMVGKFCVTSSFGLLYLYTIELYPTVVRNVALGSFSMFARVGSIIAPFVKELGQASHPSVPNILNGVLSITGGLLALLLPETRGQAMPDTLEEGENFGQFKS